jgi:hypothetical protein
VQDVSLANLEAVDDVATAMGAPFAAIVTAKPRGGKLGSEPPMARAFVHEPDAMRGAMTDDVAADAFLRFGYERLPAREVAGAPAGGARAEAALSLYMRPLEIVYSAPLLSRLRAFLASPSAGVNMHAWTGSALFIFLLCFGQTSPRSSRQRRLMNCDLCVTGRRDVCTTRKLYCAHDDSRHNRFETRHYRYAHRIAVSFLVDIQV